MALPKPKMEGKTGRIYAGLGVGTTALLLSGCVSASPANNTAKSDKLDNSNTYAVINCDGKESTVYFSSPVNPAAAGYAEFIVKKGIYGAVNSGSVIGVKKISSPNSPSLAAVALQSLDTPAASTVAPVPLSPDQLHYEANGFPIGNGIPLVLTEKVSTPDGFGDKSGAINYVLYVTEDTVTLSCR